TAHENVPANRGVVEELVRFAIVQRSCVFFFQAEDGIRDKLVTGVQTCALPISFADVLTSKLFEKQRGIQDIRTTSLFGAIKHTRSEERRVGKECRSRWSAYH